MKDLSPVKLSDITAFVLAGGLGTRLRSVVGEFPKILAPVSGRPFICRILDQLSTAGIIRVVLCTGYRAELVQSELGDSYGTIQLEYSQETSLLGTGGALANARHITASPWILAMNGDSYAECELRTFWEWHVCSKSKASLLLSEVPDSRRFGSVQMDEANKITRFTEKNEAGSAGWVNAGIYLLSDQIIRGIPTDRAVSLEKEIFPCLAKKGELHGFAGCRRLLDIGTPDSFMEAEKFFARWK